MNTLIHLFTHSFAQSVMSIVTHCTFFLVCATIFIACLYRENKGKRRGEKGLKMLYNWTNVQLYNALSWIVTHLLLLSPHKASSFMAHWHWLIQYTVRIERAQFKHIQSVLKVHSQLMR